MTTAILEWTRSRFEACCSVCVHFTVCVQFSIYERTNHLGILYYEGIFCSYEKQRSLLVAQKYRPMAAANLYSTVVQ